MSRRLAIAALTVPLAATGCGDPVGYPTLAPRPIEQVSLAEPATPPPPTGTATGQADARFASLLDPIRTGDAAFSRALGEAKPVLAAGRSAPVGSDAWAAAQQQVSRLQALRDPVAGALSALEDAAADPDTQADPGLAAAAERALATGRAIDAAEAAALSRLAPAAF